MPTTTMSGSDAIHREIIPRITTELSTTMTFSGCWCVTFGVEVLANAILMVHHYGQAAHARQGADGR